MTKKRKNKKKIIGYINANMNLTHRRRSKIIMPIPGLIV